MKTSDYIMKYLEGITDSVFLMSGGGIMHLVDSLGKSRLKSYCCHHEQGAAIAAEGYSRIWNKEKIGVALVTTGPGGTNAITGVAGAWLDSIPMLILNGQVKRSDIAPCKNGKPLTRAIGFQELNNIDLFRPITKYAVTVEDENEIRYHLEKAVFLANEGRPGPVWLEIPLDVQAADINPEKIRRFVSSGSVKKPDSVLINKVVELLEKSKRPLLIAGNGIRLAGGEDILWKFLKKTKINVVTPIFTADDLVTEQYPHYLGRQGMPGNQAANYAVDNCDLLLIIGERMQLTQTTYDYQKFAPQATKIMVDIDEEEMRKKTIKIDLPIHCDAKVFLEELYKKSPKLNRWEVKTKPINANSYSGKKKYLNIYKFWEKLSDLAEGAHIATANGMVSLTSHQALRIKRGQRFITNAGLGHMGSGLPLAIGASVASGEKPVICLEGDGSIMLNIQELQTVLHHKLPLKIFILNNDGYFSIRNTHQNYFQKVFAADPSSGVSLPNFEKLIKAWGLPYQRISNDNQLSKLKKVLDAKGPIVCELMVDPNQPTLPRWEAGSLKDEV
ncbi:thiamine pyrophosphate-binding protein [Patescibacteria group bacterium]|nr:thiamine pyrophosphate-binding protein [Patescibacteria group bacterium]